MVVCCQALDLSSFRGGVEHGCLPCRLEVSLVGVGFASASFDLGAVFL